MAIAPLKRNKFLNSESLADTLGGVVPRFFLRNKQETNGDSEPVKRGQYKTKVYLHYRLMHIMGGVLTILWFTGAYGFLQSGLGWENLGSLLAHEIFGVIAGILTPIGLIWVTIGFIERGKQIREETQMLRWYFDRLVFPTSFLFCF